MAFLNKGLTITLTDERPAHADPETGAPLSFTYKYDGGIVDYVRHLNDDQDALAPDDPGRSRPRTPSGTSRWRSRCSGTSSFNESVYTFANTINTHEGGTHEEGFRSSLTSLVNKFGRAVEAAQGEGRRTSPVRTSARA